MNDLTTTWKSRSRRERELNIGVDWVLRGVLDSEAGVDLLLASRSEPIPGLTASWSRFAGELDESGVARELAESDTITAGLMRAALLARRRVIGLYELRGFRQAVDALYDAGQIRVSPRSGGVLVVCHSRWNFGRSNDADAIGSGWQLVRRQVQSDPRDLAAYLDIPILAPSTPAECTRLVNEAIRLSRAAGSLVMLYLSPLIMAGGETEPHMEDSAQRGVPSIGDPRGEDRGNPFQTEVRRRRLDQVFNAPLPGEVVPLGFVTFGSAHAVLRHALALLGLTGRLPILRLGCINPFDTRPIEQFLGRCERVIVVENGGPLIERSVQGLADALRRTGQRAADVYGKRLPQVDDQGAGQIACDAELHPSDLAESLGELLVDRRTVSGAESVAQRLASLRSARSGRMRITLERSRREPREQSLIRPLVDTILDQLRDELSLPSPDRAAVELRVESLETATLERLEGQRQVIEMERRRVPTVGRSAITHAILRRHETTFLVLPDPPDRQSGIEPADVDRLARSMVSERDSRQLRIVRTDPTDLVVFRQDLRAALLGSGVSVVIIDARGERDPENVAGPARLWTERGFAPLEATIIPSSPLAALAYAWLVRRGWSRTPQLNGVHGPRLVVADPADPLTTPLDAWPGFEEMRLYRRAAPKRESLDTQSQLPDPTLRHSHVAAWQAHICGRTESDVMQALRLIDATGRRMGYRVQVLCARAGNSWFGHLVFTHPRSNEPVQPITPRIAYGGAHLIIAMDLESLVDSIDADSRLAVASPENTSLVLDLSPSVAASFEERTLEPRYIVPGELNSIIPPVERLVLRASELCGRRLKSRQNVASALTGAAFQRGLIPVAASTLQDAAIALDDHGLGQHPEAVAFGRSLAATTPDQMPLEESAPKSPESLVRLHAAIMSRRRWRRGQHAEPFRQLALGTLDAVTGLRRGDASRVSERRFVARLIDCECWGGLPLARLYAELVSRIYAAERSPSNYPVTRLAIDEVARSLLIADGPFVARTALRVDRQRRLMRELGADRAGGDTMTVRVRGEVRQHPLRAIIGGYWSLGGVGLRALALLRHARVIASWHRKDREYRAWVTQLARDCADELPERASLWLEIFRQLTRVRGYGVRRDARMRRVRTAVQSMLEVAGPRGDQSSLTADAGAALEESACDPAKHD